MNTTPKILHTLFSTLLIGSYSITASCAPVAPHPFEDKTNIDIFISEMVKEHQFDGQQLKILFDKARLQPAILDAIARPAESKPWYDYRPIFVNRERIQGGVTFLNTHAALLAKASDQYGVPPQIMTAIIGVETRYGKQSGSYLVLDSLSTLAFNYPPRSPFFRGELKQYLLMSREENLDPLDQRGSYAGAMGMPQFIPSSFRRFAVDFDADGKRDLWTNYADVIGSIGNYFEKHGWRSWEPIATRVQVEGDKYQAFIDDSPKPRHDVADLRKAGVLFPDDVSEQFKGSLIMLESNSGPEYWVVWHNFYVITRYNRSKLYAMSVYQLAREIVAAR